MMRSGSPIIASPTPGGRLRGKIGALAEIALVVFAAAIAGKLINSWLNIPLDDIYLQPESGGEPNFLMATWVICQRFIPEFSVLIGIIVVLSVIRGVKIRTEFSLSLGSNNIAQIVRFSIVLALVSTIPSQALQVARDIWNLGEKTWWWNFERTVDWDWTFWLYTGATSWLVIPIIEEFYARGYSFSRLREHFSLNGAMLISAAFFMLIHTQYYKPDLLNLGTLVVSTFHMYLWAYATYKTQSLLPAVFAHAFTNLPMNHSAAIFFLISSILALIIFIKPIIRHAAILFKIIKDTDDWAAIIICLALIPLFTLTSELSNALVVVWLIILAGATLTISLRTPHQRRTET